MNTQAKPCNCVAAGDILVNCASGSVTQNTKPRVKQRFLAIEGIKAQEAMYGKGLRLHNRRVAKGKAVGWTCTVCGQRKAE
jgi:hypothetical protein